MAEEIERAEWADPIELLPEQSLYSGDGSHVGWVASPKAMDLRIVEVLDELAELKAYMTIEDGDTCMVLDEGRQDIEGEAVKMSDHAIMMYMCKTIGELYGAVTALIRRVEDGNGF